MEHFASLAFYKYNQYFCIIRVALQQGNNLNEQGYTHNIIRLVQESGLKDVITAEQLSFIAEMMPLNIQTRYPEYKDQLFKQLSEERCKQIIETTKSTIEWIKTKL